ncbi:MAG: hypothetical protein EXX96DRAFT_564768 [Benjaminiella poitrasii]|nr:MAG: hypothetical protein EXX96DRAFT_564768 [Benjaminiella poitrasii]
MLNTDQILFIVIIVITLTLVMLGVITMMNKSSIRRRELLDLEKRIEAQEQFSGEYLSKSSNNTLLDMFEPAKIRQNRHEQKPATLPAPIVIMTPQKEKRVKSKRESLLGKVYGFKLSSAPLSPTLSTQGPIINRPSTIRPPSFLPMQEKSIRDHEHPPAYDEYCMSSTPIIHFAGRTI